MTACSLLPRPAITYNSLFNCRETVTLGIAHNYRQVQPRCDERNKNRDKAYSICDLSYA